VPANETARANWNGPSADAWTADADRRDAVLAPVRDALLDAAALAEGERVLDVGCGCGATSLAAAGFVGPKGRVLGLDIGEPMLAVARQRAKEQGKHLAHVEFVAGDAQTHELEPEHDVAMSRFGTMFFDDPVAAFANIATGLKPRGRLVMATWAPLPENEWVTVAAEAVRPFGAVALPGPEEPGMFSQSTAIRVARLLGAFTDVDVRPMRVPMSLGDRAAATDYLASMGLIRAVLEPLGAGTRAKAVAAIAAKLPANHVVLDGAILLTTARRR
jgi:SAM-dependent methyltransferase